MTDTPSKKKASGDARTGARIRIPPGYGSGERAFVTGTLRNTAAGRRGAASQMKGEVLSHAAHELCAPVATICGLAEMLLKHDPDEAREREFLSIISSKSALLSMIVGDLVELSGLVSKQGGDFVFASSDVHALLQQAIAAFGTPAGRAAPVVCAAKHRVFIMADRNRLVQAIVKAIAQVYQCSPSGVVLRVSASARFSGEARRNGPRSIGIHILGNDSGADAQALKRAGERHRRSGASGEVPGMGLGMSVVREIVDSHGGELLLRSRTSGGGITLSFPESVEPERACGSATGRVRRAALSDRSKAAQ